MKTIYSTFIAAIERRWLSILLLIAYLVVYAIYTYAGRSLITDVYEGTALGFLSGGIEGRGTIPLEVYYRKADAIFVSMTVFIALVVVFSRVSDPLRYFLYFFSWILCLFIFREESGEDFYHHLSRLTDICANLKTGDWYLFISRNAAAGKGLPIYVYYSWWLGVIPYFISYFGLSAFTTMKATMLLLLAFSSLGMFIALRLFVNCNWAALGALLYASSNFVLENVFPRSNLGSAYGACLIPFVFYALARWLLHNRIRDAVLLSLIWAFLLIVHPLVFINSSLGFIMVAVIYVVWNTRGADQWSRRLCQALIIVLLLLVNSGVFLVPALCESQYVYLHHHGLLRFRPETFLNLKAYLQFLDYFRNAGFLVTAGIIMSIWFVIFKRRALREENNSMLIGASLAAVAMYVFLTLRISIFIWKRVDVLQGNQYPWRMVLPITFFGIICTIMVLDNLFRRLSERRSPNWRTMLFRLTLLQGVIFLLPQVQRISGEDQAPKIESKLREYWHKDSGWGVDEYIPNPANIPVVHADSIVGEADVRKREYSARNEIFWIAPVAKDGLYTLPKYWHARYRVYVDGKEIDQKSDPTGRMVVLLYRGTDSLVIRYGKPWYVSWSEILSLMSIAASICGLGYLAVSRRRGQNIIRDRRHINETEW